MMVKRKNYFQNPLSRQNFANAFAETPNLNLEVRRNALLLSFGLAGWMAEFNLLVDLVQVA